ncbi:FAD-dependent oxidoreductase [bacterium]|nr:FAD-dependent oxidoreductase [bacterium]
MKLQLLLPLFIAIIALSQQINLLSPSFMKPLSEFNASLKISFREKADVVVIGGGPAGSCAAIAAALEGVKVILIERFDFLGGAGTAMGVSLFMGQEVVGGLYDKIRERLKELGGIKGNAYDPDAMKAVLYDMCREQGVRILFDSLAMGVVKESTSLKAILIHNPYFGLGMVEGKIFIDATGNGDVAVAAGAPYEISPDERIMPLTLCYVLWWQNGWPPLWRNYGAVWRMDPYRVFANQTRIPTNPIDPFKLTEAEGEGRRETLEQVEELLGKGYNVRLISSGPHIGIRESRRIIGDYVLTGEDVLSGKMFDDRIALCNYPIDIHYQQKSKDLQAVTGRFEKVPIYSIPYRCLLPKKINNLLVAGRCISATQEAMASFRIQPTSMAIGTAAGIAGALSAKLNISPRQVDARSIQAELRKLGQILDKPREEQKN